MSGARLSWIGPNASPLLDRAIREAPVGPPVLWLVPTAIGRDRVEWRLTQHARSARAAGVMTWEDLWAWVRSRSPRGPGRLSAAASRAVLVTAIRLTRRAGMLGSLGSLAETAGYRRRLASRISAWTRAGRRPEGDPPNGAPLEDWEVFRRYRKLLKAKSLACEDADGFGLWAAGALKELIGDLVGPGGSVVLHDPTLLPAPILRRVLAAFQGFEGGLLVTLPGEPGEDRREVFGDIESLRSRLRAQGFVESVHPSVDDRPRGLAHLLRELFRIDPAEPSTEADGLRVLSAPRGEGLALVLAREVRDRLEAGVSPDDLLVLFPRWDEQADLVRETLRSWGLPASGGPTRPLSCEPAVNAWLAALAIPIEGWEASRLIRLLRHGRFRPDWPEIQPARSLAITAAAIRDSRVFRDRDAIRRALQDAATWAPDEKNQGEVRHHEHSKTALPILDRLIDTLEGLDRPATWREQADKARAIATNLGLDADADDPAMARLLADIDDHAATLEALGRGDEVVYWDDFVRELEAIVREHPPDPEPIAPGSIRLATVSEAEGAEVRHVLLAGLEEGRFPNRDLIDLDPATREEDESDPSPNAAVLGREMRRFLGVAAMARETLTWLYPSTDEKGQELLRAGFLDDAQRLFTREAWEAVQTEIHYLDPILPAELAVAAVENRVSVVGRACLSPSPESLAELAALAARPEHRPALAGAAAALRLHHRRMRRTRFGPYEGRLGDPRAIREIAEKHGANRPLFSASQLETLASCPFKYFLRHVLKLEPIDDRGEFDEDYTRRGLLVHEALETLHQLLKSEGENGVPLPERVGEKIGGVIDGLLDQQREPTSDVEREIQRIDAERLRRIGLRYARQFAIYHDGSTTITCHDFEVHFGQADAPYPGLVLGGETDGFRLQGMIDRIDLLTIDGRLYFRIIDYKTGACPSKKQVAEGLALQLPLYTLAAERHVLANLGAEPIDAAYWGLRDDKKWYSPALVIARIDRKGGLKVVGDWEATRRKLETFVLALVDRLRHADFPVAPREKDCTQYCDFRHVCRIGQLRQANKAWPEKPTMPREENE